MTPQPRIHAQILEDRSYVHQPNTVKSNKPITIGHAYSSVVLFPEEEGEHGPVWAVPLGVQRVKSSEDKEMVGAQQVQTLLNDETLPFQSELCVEVEDSGYSKPAFLAKNRKKTNLVTITRSRNSRTFYRQPPAMTGEEGVGHPTWYGAPFALPEVLLHDPPDF